MWMFSRTLPRLVDSGTLKMCGKQIQTFLCNINTIGLSQSYCTVLNITKLRQCDKTNRFLLYHNANLQTSAKFCNSDHDEEKKKNVKLIFMRPDGEEIVLFGKAGQTVMEAAIQREGIMQASCDGQLACTTCHVYVDQNIKHLFPESSLEEDDLLDNAPFCKPHSRLSCQLVLTAEMTEAKFGLPTATSNMSVDSSSGKSKTKYEKPEGNSDSKNGSDKKS